MYFRPTDYEKRKRKEKETENKWDTKCKSLEAHGDNNESGTLGLEHLSTKTTDGEKLTEPYKIDHSISR